MTTELAEHISLLAAPIYAALLRIYTQRTTGRITLGDAVLQELRHQALTEARALWDEALAA